MRLAEKLDWKGLNKFIKNQINKQNFMPFLMLIKFLSLF
jgi:hypothetical protein